jgi:hypothetical protein
MRYSIRGSSPTRSATLGDRPGTGAPAQAPGLPPEQQQLVAALVPLVDLWQRLLTVHRPDAAGRCRSCTKGGTGLSAIPWPCSLHGLAELARRRHSEIAA